MPSLPLGGAGSTGPGTFSPLSLAGFELWLKADALALTDGTAVGTWTDSSGNGNNATQATGANQPIYKTNIVNGKPVLRFDGVNDEMTVATITGNDVTRSMFVVCARSAVVALQGIIGFSSAAAMLADGSGGQWFYSQNQAGGNQNIGADSAAFTLLSIRFNTTGSADAYVNNSAAVNFDPADTYQAGGTFRIGSANSSFFFTGDIAEILVYNSALSNTDLDSVRTYLRSKYGL